MDCFNRDVIILDMDNFHRVGFIEDPLPSPAFVTFLDFTRGEWPLSCHVCSPSHLLACCTGFRWADSIHG